MVSWKVTVAPEKVHPSLLPEWASQYVLATQSQLKQGVLEQIEQRLRLQRQGGYCGLDAVLFLQCYFLSAQRCGLQKFGRLCQPYGNLLAAAGGRSKWPSPSSISRLLSVVSMEHSEQFGQWLLEQALPTEALTGHQAAQAHDRLGHSWHLVDWDPTYTTLRQRALPRGQALPQPIRQATSVGAPGYAGRKRGELQLGRATLQHSGTSQWLGLWSVPGNAPRLKQTRLAAKTVEQFCQRHGIDVGRALLRCDGQAAPGVCSRLSFEQLGIHYLTRLSRYEILKWPEVEEHLRTVQYEPVADSLSGPKREAAELGWVQLWASAKGKAATEVPSHKARVILSRFAARQSQRGAGVVRGPWHYELFVTSVPELNWSASELVTTYYGRSAQENRFCQEDSQLGLDRILSYHLPGQHLASAIGLYCWNLRLCLGAELAGLKSNPSDAIDGTREVETLPRSSGPQPSLTHPQAQEPPPEQLKDHDSSSEPLPLVPQQASAHGSGPQPSLTHPQAQEPPGTQTAHEDPRNHDHAQTPQQQLSSLAQTRRGLSRLSKSWARLELLDSADWDAKLKNYPGWHWELAQGGLLCPQQQPLDLNRFSVLASQQVLAARFRAPRSACALCPQRSLCTDSTSSRYTKEVELRFDLKALPSLSSPNLRSARSSAGSKPTTPQLPRWRAPSTHCASSSVSVRWPLLLPAMLSQTFIGLCLSLQICLKLLLPPPPKATPPYVAANAAQRQRRRKTWQQRFAHNQLPPKAIVTINIYGASSKLQTLEFCPTRSPPLAPKTQFTQ